MTKWPKCVILYSEMTVKDWPDNVEPSLEALAEWCDKKQPSDGHYFFELMYAGNVGGKPRWHIELSFQRDGWQNALCIGDGDGATKAEALDRLVLLIRETGCPID